MTAPRRTLSPLCTMLMCAFALSALPATAASRISAAADVSVPVMQPLPMRDAAGGMWPVQLDVARLRAARAGDTLRFTLPDGSSLDIVFASLLGGASGLQWIGHHAAGRQYAVRLRLDGELAAGIIRTPDGGFVLGHVDGVQLIGPDLSAAANPVVLDGLPSMFLAANVATNAGSASRFV